MKRYPFIKQDGIKDCGVTCLSMIIEYYNGFTNIEKLREMTNTNKNGVSAYNLVEAAKQLGFESYGMNYDLLDKNAVNINLPAIAHVIINNSYKHFVVIYEINFKKQYLLVADPADKLKKISFEEFSKIFTKNLLIMYPIRKINKDKKITIKKYLKNFLSNKNTLLLFVLMIFSLSLTFAYLLLLKFLVSSTLNVKIFIYVFILIIIKFLLNNLKNKKFLNTSINVNRSLMNDTFFKILSLPYKYYRNRTTGEIVSRLNDIDNLKDITIIFIFLITDIFLFLITGILLFITNKLLFSISILMLCLYVFNYFYFNKKIFNYLECLKQDKSLVNSFMVESINGFESIKGQNLEDKMNKKFILKNETYLNSLKNYQNIKNKMNNIKDFISDFSTILILGIGLLLIKNNQLSFSSLLLFYTLLNYFLDPIQNLVELNIIIDDIKLSLKRIIELEYNQEQANKKSVVGNINFNETFFEQDDKIILENITFNIKQNDKIMMIGQSGSGKSTILKLLKQYYQANNIYINTLNINDINLKNNITYISQNEYLFTDTLYNNIVMDRKVDNLDRVIDICELKEIIDRNDLGLNMLIEENGFNLSGGEKQRIILARALLNDSKYLFIDEGLSEVDINLERKIIKKILKYYKDKTIIIVSHRLDNMDLFDKVIKVDKKVDILTKNKGGVLCYSE